MDVSSFLKMNTSTIPTYLILDTEDDTRKLGWLTQYLPVEEGEVFRVILDCLRYEASAQGELALMMSEIETSMFDRGHEQYAVNTVKMMADLGQKIFTNLKSLGAYHNGYLIYSFHEDLHGDLVLEKFHPEDFQLH